MTLPRTIRRREMRKRAKRRKHSGGPSRSSPAGLNAIYGEVFRDYVRANLDADRSLVALFRTRR